MALRALTRGVNKMIVKAVCKLAYKQVLVTVCTRSNASKALKVFIFVYFLKYKSIINITTPPNSFPLCLPAPRPSCNSKRPSKSQIISALQKPISGLLQKNDSLFSTKLLHGFFSVVDVVGVLTESADYQLARNYWKVLKHRLTKEGFEPVTNCNQLKLVANDGKRRETDVADLEGILRIIQSIPSKKAEPVKRWLAQVGSERFYQMQDELPFNKEE